MTDSTAMARKLLIGTTVVILVVGILAVGTASSFYSLRDTHSDATYLRNHLIRIVFGIAACAVLSFRSGTFFKRIALPVYILSFLAIVATLVFKETQYAPRINGSVRWLDLGIRILPSDFMRFGFVLVSALLISNGTVDIRTFKGVLAVASLALVPSVFTMIQPDLSGTAFTLFVMLIVLFVAGAKFSHLLILMSALLLLGAGAVLVRDDYQLNRIKASLQGDSLEQDDNYQTLQARIALGSGGFYGRGLGQSRQKRGFLPEAYTDFILAVIGEESGFLGTTVVMMLFFLLFSSALWMSKSASSSFGAVVGGGVTAILITGVMIHTMVNSGVIPVTGMPLPLISWGGTSMMVSLISIGTVLGISKRSPA
ncbi:MAG: FtsW/RodA/SpoVE family cell cycle protein [Candidatus Fermentibacteraceae bacterium]|nr:FtsW/RodA/SpoVE family cell cycle protein [Candidatus Fermentibacteraceae bacterium]